MKRLTLLSALAFLLFGAAPAAQATASPILNLDLHHNSTNFHPGGDPVALNTSTLTEGASPSTDEVQQLTRGYATAGNFKLSFDGPSTPNLPFDADAGQVQAALEALPSIGAGNVEVSSNNSGGSETVFTISFTGALATTDVHQIVASNGSPRLALQPDYWIDLSNVGPDPTSGPLTVTLDLPSGITRAAVTPNFAGNAYGGSWSCPGSPGDNSVVCTFSGSLPRHIVYPALDVRVNPSSSLSPGVTETATATVSGGGAPTAPPAANCPPATAACASEPTLIEVDPAPAAILASSFTPGFFAADGLTPALQAGSHPDLLKVPFDLASINRVFTPGFLGEKSPSGTIRDLRADPPSGFIGAPGAVGECPQASLILSLCPFSSQVGRLDVMLSQPPSAVHTWAEPVFNMTHPVGALSELATVIAGNPVHIFAALDPAQNYAITTQVPVINETYPPLDQQLTLWGVPADSSHDSERCRVLPLSSIATDNECSAGAPPKPFLTLPARCDEQQSWRLYNYDFWQHPGAFGPEIDYTTPDQLSGCDQIPFAPTISATPTTDAADSHSGLDLQIDLPQDTNPDIGTSPLKDATVTLPQGITVNPASANGLDACSPAQISLGSNDPIACPDAARIADVQVTTPALPEPVQGTVYLATPYDNPFNSLLAGYIVLSDPSRGLLVKIPGRIDVNPDTGQLTGTFKDNPQLPFSQFQLHFKGGVHSSLITPKTCGDYTSNADFAPWSGNADVQPSDSFTIAQGAGGGSCPASESDQPNSPTFDAGPVSPISAHYSPFVLHLRREDGSQRFGAFNVTLPKGMTGKLAGTALCPDGALEAARSKNGRDEQASPSCPLDSHVGEVVAGAGAGPDPYNAKGDAYLAGPYKGAPVSLAVITPAVAGPFDLGTIVIRTPLQIDPTTAQISAVSDPIPQMLQGIPTDVRSVDVVMDRPDFTLTGTSCDPASIDGLLTSTLNQTAPLSVRYQLSDCGRLGFKPAFKLGLKGGTKRNGHPAFKTTITYPKGDYANLSYAQVTLPKQIQLDQSHIQAPCTRPQFAAGQCSDASIIGTATATSPLIDYALSGPVYLRTGSNPLPDVVLDLHGPASQPIRITQVGKVDTVNARLRTTFDTIPDAPISTATVSLLGGSKGLLVNNSSLCPGPDIATLRLAAHNGDSMHLNPKVAVAGCKKAKKHKDHKRHAKRHHRRALR